MLTIGEFGKCLGFPSEGERIRLGYSCDWQGYEKLQYYFSISRFTKQEIFSKKHSASNQLILYSSNLSVSDRMLHYFIAYILLPKHSNNSQISDTEMQALYALKNHIKVNWAYVIMFHMLHEWGLTGGLPYGILVTKILKYFDISFKREPKKEVTSKVCEINVKASNKNMRIFKDKDGIYKHLDQIPSSSFEVSVPKGGYSNEFLYNKICSLENLMTTGF